MGYLEKKERERAAKEARDKRDALETELLAACGKGHYGSVKLMLKTTKVDPECGRCDLLRGKAARERDSPLIAAAKSGSVETVQALVDRGAEVKQECWSKGRNALHWACKRGHFELCLFLVKKGLDTRKADRDGRTPLMHASWWGHSKICKLLFTGPASNADHVNVRDKKRGWSALLGAAKYSQVETVKLIVKTVVGTDMNATDIHGRTALLHTTCPAVAALILEAGAKVEAIDPATGRSLLHWASENGEYDLTHTILEHVKKSRKDPELMRKLLVDLDYLTGCAPQPLAERNGHRTVKKILRQGDFFAYQALEAAHSSNMKSLKDS